MAFSKIELKYIENTVGKMCRHHSLPRYEKELKFTYEVNRHDVSVWEMRPAFCESRWWFWIE